jgi:hypothetical protein
MQTGTWLECLVCAHLDPFQSCLEGVLPRG